MLDLLRTKTFRCCLLLQPIQSSFLRKQAELLQRLHDPLALVTCNALNTFLLKENSELGKEKSKLLESLEIEKRKPIVNFLKHSPSLSSIAGQIEKLHPQRPPF